MKMRTGVSTKSLDFNKYRLLLPLCVNCILKSAEEEYTVECQVVVKMHISCSNFVQECYVFSKQVVTIFCCCPPKGKITFKRVYYCFVNMQFIAGHFTRTYVPECKQLDPYYSGIYSTVGTVRGSLIGSMFHCI